MEYQSLNAFINTSRTGYATTVFKDQTVPVGSMNAANNQSQPVQAEFTQLVDFALSHEIQDLTLSSNSTSFTYTSQDQHISMQINSSIEAKSHSEKTVLNLTFSAEVLGLTQVDFIANENKPMQYQLLFKYTQTEINHHISAQMVKPLRKPEDILFDLVSAIQKALKVPGDKSIRLAFDMEAIQSLLQNNVAKELLDEIIALIGIINNLKLSSNPLHDEYAILVSGKGKPYLQVNEKTKVESQSIIVEINLTINPPHATSNEPVVDTVQQETVPETTPTEIVPVIST